MAGLDDLLRAARETPDHSRAKILARNDYKLMSDLVKVRQSNGLSQDDVAHILGISQQAVSKLESYDSDPKLSTLRRYALAIGALVEHTVSSDQIRGESLHVKLAASYSGVYNLQGSKVRRRTYKAEPSLQLDFALVA